MMMPSSKNLRAEFAILGDLVELDVLQRQH